VWTQSLVWKETGPARSRIFDRCMTRGLELEDAQLHSPMMLQAFTIAAFANQVARATRNRNSSS
jgi:hypothetical protein